MNLFVQGGIILVVAALCVGLLWLARRSPWNDRFSSELGEHERAFEFLGVAFAVLLAFVVLEAYDIYNDAKNGSEQEAQAVLQMSRTTAAFGPDDQAEMKGLLVCYGRSVIEQAWPAMEQEEGSTIVNDWALRIRDSAFGLDGQTLVQQAALRQLLVEQDSRTEGRRIRLAEAIRNVPSPLWFVLILGAFLTIGWVVLGSDRRGSLLVQACVVGSVAALVTASLLLIWFLDHPFSGHSGSIKPVAMEEVIQLMEHESAQEELTVTPPCDESGNPT